MSGINIDLIHFKKLKSGSNEALETLFRKYYSPLCLYVQSIVNDSFLSEEIVTDLFTDLWIKRFKIEIESNVKAYLYVAARNGALAYKRKKKINTQNINDLNLVELSYQFEPFEDEDFEMKKSSIDAILKQIPPKSRQAFILHRFEKMKYKEVAEFLDISIKTVENHIGKAIKIVQENSDLIRKVLKFSVVLVILNF